MQLRAEIQALLRGSLSGTGAGSVGRVPGADAFAIAGRSKRTHGAAALAFALTLGALPADAGDYREEIMEQVIRPCILHLSRLRPVEGVSPEVIAEAVMARRSRDLARIVDGIDREIASDTPAVARRQIYRIALRSCLRQGAAVFRER